MPYTYMKSLHFLLFTRGYQGAGIESWLVNLTPPNVPPPKLDFNKALLRETNG